MSAPNAESVWPKATGLTAAQRALLDERSDDDGGGGVRRPKGSECECITCGDFFGSPSAFDRHLAKTGCNPPGEVRHRKTGEDVFRQIPRAGGPTWILAGEREWPTTTTAPGVTPAPS